MDMFKYHDTTLGMTYPGSGEIIQGAKRVMWVERYDEPGELTIEAPLSSDLRQFLPAGVLIGRPDTSEVMVVENHEISQDNYEDSFLSITGRSYISVLENRLVGLIEARSNNAVIDITYVSDQTWNQIVTLISFSTNGASESDDEIPYIDVYTDLPDSGGTSEERVINRGDVLTEVLNLLKIDNCGIRTVKNIPGLLRFEVYQGTDRSKNVIFSWTGEDLKSANYLLSNRKLKNCAMVVGRWVWRMVDGTQTGYDRRMMLVDATDIDGHLETMPTGGSLTTIQNKMTTRGRQALRKQRNISLQSAELSNITEYQYREDYFLGDIVMLEGDFNQQEKKRISEYAETLDENGYSGHPTFRSLADEVE